MYTQVITTPNSARYQSINMIKIIPAPAPSLQYSHFVSKANRPRISGQEGVG